VSDPLLNKLLENELGHDEKPILESQKQSFAFQVECLKMEIDIRHHQDLVIYYFCTI